MKILVLGGSYFYGRVFTMLTTNEYQLTLFNRGTYSMVDFHVKELVGDRNEVDSLRQIQEEKFDVVVDFCAYKKEDIRQLFEVLPATVKQYILISTVDVYERGTGQVHAENFPYEKRNFEGEAGAYIFGKVQAEQECMICCKERKINYTILRPAILYGPYNYAPRESAFIQLALQNHILAEITDADGQFQFIYVKDAALAIQRCIMNSSVFNKKINLAGDEIITYKVFTDALESVIKKEGYSEYQKLLIDVSKAMEIGIPLPFPVYDNETELCDAGLSKELLGLEYTSLERGMEKTYEAFKKVFR